jgi:dipeptidyl aminopeptidase/acylaminoacyl peptidase
VRRKAFERRLREELHEARPPHAAEAERRAWAVVRAAHAERGAVRRPMRGRRLAVAAVTAALAAVLALSPAGAKVGDWIGDVVDPAPDATPSTLGSLPSDGRLLVVSPAGPWIVHDDGARRRLGDFRDATWSPGGLFVAAARGRELVAREPDGDEVWARPAPGQVSAPRWSPDGFRIAYRSGRDLWIAVGNNSGAERLARGIGPAPPAWRPNAPTPGQVVAFSSGRRIRIVEEDTPRLIGTTPPGPVPRELWWTADGRRLVAVSSGQIRVHDGRGRLLRRESLPPGVRATGSALDTAGRRLAVAAEETARRASEVLVFRLDGPRRRLDRTAPPDRLYAGPGSIEGLTWSIDGRVLVLGLPEADQWLLVRPRAREPLREVSGIRRKFAGGNSAAARVTAPFPRPAGWCYVERPEPAAAGVPPCTTGAAPAGELVP